MKGSKWKQYLIASVLAVIASIVGAAHGAAQGLEQQNLGGMTEGATVSVGRTRPYLEFGAAQRSPNKVRVVGRRWGASAPKLNPVAAVFHRIVGHQKSDPATLLASNCQAARRDYIFLSENKGAAAAEAFADQTARTLGCGYKVYQDDTHNLITSVGQDRLSDLISKISSPPNQFNYVALTNTAITPAKGDTTLSGEIGSNGLQRQQGTFTNTSAALGTAPTGGAVSQVGTTGAASLWYWVQACTYQGCTALGSSTNTTTSNATLSTTVYNTFTFTGKLGAAYYLIVRDDAAGPPSGSLPGGAAQTAAGIISAGSIDCGLSGLTAGTAPTCTVRDMSNTTNAYTIPASDQTYAGSHTLTKTFTATGTQAAQAFGIFNASSSGDLLALGTFTSASLVTNDTLSFTWTMYH